MTIELNKDKMNKGIKEAYYYSKTSNGVRCLLCPNQCLLKEGDISLCSTRFNKDNILYTNAYGNPCVVNIDPIEKKPLFHFLPASKALSISSAGCTFACLNCQNWEISQESPVNGRQYNFLPKKVVEEALANKTESIAYTYGEPIAFYEYALETSKIAKAKGIKNLLISNGYINEKPLRELSKFTDAANINLKSFDDDIYVMLNRGKLKPVLNTLKILKEENVWLEITNLIVPEWTDNMDMIKKMCEWLCENQLDTQPLHFSRFHPTYKLLELNATPLSALENARKTAIDAGIKYVYLGNVANHEAENTYCHNCRKMIIERNGFTFLSNNITDGHCNFCNEKIPGTWK